MAKFTVHTPEPDYAGAVGGVQFADGAAEVDDETHAAALAYFRGAGYSVQPVEEAKQEPETPKRTGRRTSTSTKEDGQ